MAYRTVVTVFIARWADNGQSVRTQAATRCYVYANDTSHGGGPLVGCQLPGAVPFD